uniref:RPN1 N-terminal domain-containing protein n=1 Tax=Timema genevievae TaxID=629358 RepID=A0A7R9K1R6_TIMGE|nr:unnamed protein product [Timema genevievae]
MDSESEEDKRLQEELNMLVEKLCEKDEKLYHPALECLRDLIRTSTTSMTSVPKPLKYLRTHYNTIKEAYLRMKDPEVQKFCADIISVLAMTQLNDTDQAAERECLKYCLLGTKSDVGDWGHEYVRQLESEIAEEWILITEERNRATKAQLLSIVDMIVSFDMSHNAEIQACDLLMEIDEIDRLRDYIDASNYSRVCLYLISCALYVDKPEYIKIINLVLDFFLKFREYTRAMCLAMNLNDVKLMTRIFESCQDGGSKGETSHYPGHCNRTLARSPEEHSGTQEELSNIDTKISTRTLRQTPILPPKKIQPWQKGISTMSSWS